MLRQLSGVNVHGAVNSTLCIRLRRNRAIQRRVLRLKLRGLKPTV